MTADSLLGKAVWCAVSVVKVDHVQGGATTNRVRRKIIISVATLNAACFGKPICYLSFEKFKLSGNGGMKHTL